MSQHNLATVTHELIASYGNTAKNVITACHAGNARAVRYMDHNWATAVQKAGTRLTADVRSNAISAQQKVTAYYAKGVETTTSNAQIAITKAVEWAGKGLVQAAANATRFEDSTGLTTLSTLAGVSLPVAQAVVKVAAKLEAQSGALAHKLAGETAKGKATRAKRSVVKSATTAAKTAAPRVRKAAKKVTPLAAE